MSETITLYRTRLLLNRTDTTGVSGTGDSATGGLDDRSVMLMDDYVEPDEFKTDNDRIAIEFGTDTQNEAVSRAVLLQKIANCYNIIRLRFKCQRIWFD